MQEELTMIYDMATDAMKESYAHLEKELRKIRAGRANASMLDSVSVDYYGSQTPLAQVANINTMDARTLTIQPWEKAMLEPIQTAITNSNLGLNPQSNGESVLINVPMLTEERRKDLVKQVRAAGEHCKVSLRSARKDALDEIKGLKDDGLSEDQTKTAEGNVQNIINDFTTKIDKTILVKEEDIMKV